MSIEINLLQDSVTALYMFFPEHIFSAFGKEFCIVRRTADLSAIAGMCQTVERISPVGQGRCWGKTARGLRLDKTSLRNNYVCITSA
jgi:hypothetical protein